MKKRFYSFYARISRGLRAEAVADLILYYMNTTITL